MAFVSRAGLKLEAALVAFGLEVRGQVCADLGANVGGFTDCLLQRGAAKVYAVDTGYGTLAWTLRKDPRVVVMERTNALHVCLPEPVDLAVIDVGWTRQVRILPAARKLLKPGGAIVTLIKPHYESDRARKTRGVLTPEEARAQVERVVEQIAGLGLAVSGLIQSPLEGQGGNIEFLAYVKA